MIEVVVRRTVEISSADGVPGVMVNGRDTSSTDVPQFEQLPRDRQIPYDRGFKTGAEAQREALALLLLLGEAELLEELLPLGRIHELHLIEADVLVVFFCESGVFWRDRLITPETATLDTPN